MTNIGYSTLTVIPVAKGFGSALSGQVDPQMAKAGTAGGKKMGGGMVAGAKSFVKPMAGLFAVSAGVAFFKGAVDGASDLAESASKVKVVFGDQSAAIEKASKTSASAMGLSKRAYLDATGGLGNLLVSLDIAPKKAASLSQEMVKLAGDMASFNNTSPEEALQALQSGLTGETEPLKRFGVNMNDATLKSQALKMGLIKTTKDALSPQAKALAAQALIMDQTSTAQGDFARTSDGLANKQRILAAKTTDLKDKIGTGLLPIVTKMTDAGIKMMDWMTKNPAAVYGLAAAVAVLGIAFVIATAPISLTVLAIAAVAAGITYAYAKFPWFKNAVDSTFKAIGAVARWLWNNAFQPMIRNIVTGIGLLLITWGKMLQGLSKVPGFGWAKKAGDAMVSAGQDALAMRDNIKKIPKKWSTRITTPGMGDAISQAQTLLGLLTSVTNQKNVNASVPGQFDPGNNADGTNYWRGGLSWVGERGPELVNLPKGSQVFTHAKSKQMAQGQGGSGSSSGAGGWPDPDVFAKALERAVTKSLTGAEFHPSARGNMKLILSGA